ncbi:hypothetical protein [Nocardioides sp.]|uniref:hypothetical protein n=1 Tax=Nocardioides sp. TaxID=35761 RepID=UPI0037831736
MVTSPRTVLTAVAAWVAVVAVGSTVVWLVISRAGDVITPTATPDLSSTSTPRTAPTSRTPHPSSGPSGSSSAPSSGSSGSSSPAAGPERRTWQGPGGLVTVECQGATITLVASSADAGFVVSPESRGPDEVDVAFEGQGEEGRETRVRAHCAQGVPTFEVDARDE